MLNAPSFFARRAADCVPADGEESDLATAGLVLRRRRRERRRPFCPLRTWRIKGRRAGRPTRSGLCLPTGRTTSGGSSRSGSAATSAQSCGPTAYRTPRRNGPRPATGLRGRPRRASCWCRRTGRVSASCRLTVACAHMVPGWVGDPRNPGDRRLPFVGRGPRGAAKRQNAGAGRPGSRPSRQQSGEGSQSERGRSDARDVAATLARRPVVGQGAASRERPWWARGPFRRSP